MAERLGANVHVGQAGDVVAGEWVLECKYRRGYRLGRLDELKYWVAQAKGNVERRGKGRWGIVLYGGRGTEYLVVVTLEEFRRLAGLGGEA